MCVKTRSIALSYGYSAPRPATILRRTSRAHGPQHLVREVLCKQPADQRLPRLIGMNTIAREQ